MKDRGRRPLTEEELKEIAKKAVQAKKEIQAEAWKDIDKFEQVNDDGTPIEESCTYRRTGDKEWTFKNGKKLDHSPKGSERGLGNINVDRYSKQLSGNKAGHETKRRQTAQKSINKFLNTKAGVKTAEKIIKNLQKDVDNQVDIKELVPDELSEELTQYDLINLAMIVKAQQGNDKASTYVRDTAGDKPTDKAQIDANVITDGDRSLLAKLMQRRQREKEEE